MPAISYDRFYAEIEALYKEPHRRKATWKKLRTVLKEFHRLPGVKKTSDITPGNLALWIEAHQDRAPITNKTYLSAFRAAVTIAKKMHWLRVSPWDIRKDWIVVEELAEDDDPEESWEPKNITFHTMAELSRVMDQADAEAITGDWLAGRDQVTLYSFAHTALRKRECLGLKHTDISIPRRLIRIRPRKKRRLKTKSSDAYVGIPEALAVVLERWLPRTGCQWVFPGVRRKGPWLEGSHGQKALDRIKALGKRAGVEGLTLLSFRHSVATHCAQWGFTELEIKDQLRHSGIKTQSWYREKDFDRIRESSDRINYGRPAPRVWAPQPPANG